MSQAFVMRGFFEVSRGQDSGVRKGVQLFSGCRDRLLPIDHGEAAPQIAIRGAIKSERIMNQSLGGISKELIASINSCRAKGLESVAWAPRRRAAIK